MTNPTGVLFLRRFEPLLWEKINILASKVNLKIAPAVGFRLSNSP